MADHWISVTEYEDTQPWSIGVDGFFRKNVERQMVADDMSPEAIDSVFSMLLEFLAIAPILMFKKNYPKQVL